MTIQQPASSSQATSPPKPPALNATAAPPQQDLPVAVPVADSTAPQTASTEQDETEDTAPRRSLLRHPVVRELGAFLTSVLVHTVLLVSLGLWMMPEESRETLKVIEARLFEERPEDDLLKTELEESLEAATEVSVAIFSSAPAVGVEGGMLAYVGTPALDQSVLDQDAEQATIDVPMLAMPSRQRLISEVPDGALGDPRAVVDSYQQAMDRITQELMWMLDKGDVLLIWCFDQSESMKDDQREIRERIERVYAELGLTDRSSGNHLLTAVTSYGENFLIHTRRGPTSNSSEIRAAIDEIPVDPSGHEMMCQAVGSAIARHRDYAKAGRRQLALILVTDESGDRDSNDRYLEPMIAEAQASRCRIYVLGREAVFGYPYAHIRWIHPQTKHHHWLRIDRGPETAFVEQLQTDGFHRRYDAFNSGFGPYEQTRMTRETGGIFFLLPSIEQDLVRGEKRRYELEAMRSYVPDIRSRMEVIADRDKYPLRTALWKVINDLNPYDADAAKIINMRVDFSLQPAEFLRQARTEQQKALIYLDYLAKAQNFLEQYTRHRQQEASPRWQANYDLIYAQIIAYQARIFEYGAYLEHFIRSPKTAPLTKSPNLRLVDWDITTRKSVLVPEKSQPYIDKSSQLLTAIIDQYPGTPWAARAQWELKRGFGVELVPDYDVPHPKPTAPLIPIPKL